MMSRALAAMLVVFALPTNVEGVLKGIATIHETKAAGTGATIRGTLFFTYTTDANGDIFMDVSGEVTGLPNGVHGFHIHQYGDESVTADGGNRYGGHFVPLCQGLPPSPCDPFSGGPCKPKEEVDPCKLMEKHGLPPDKIRQAGDMGNLLVQNGKISLPGSLQLVVKRIGQDKMSLDDQASSILGRAVAIHKYEDIGRQIPLYDKLCLSTCKVPGSTADTNPPGRTCGVKTGSAKLADIRIQDSDNVVTEAVFANINTNTQNVVVRYPSPARQDVWYRVKITEKPGAQTGDFKVEFDDQNACARRISAQYLTSGGQEEMQMPDPTGAAGPAIAGGVVGRMNPNSPIDGKTSTGSVDDTKPANQITQISCFLRATTDAGDKAIGGEALIVQQLESKKVRVQAKLTHGLNMGGKVYSFHFHDYGDLRRLNPPQGDLRLVGNIYKENDPKDILKVKTLKIPAGQTLTFVAEIYDLPEGLKGVDEYVGRSLTIHSGPGAESPTVSYGVCGLAHPDSATFFYTTPKIVYEGNTGVTLGSSVAAFVLASMFW